LAIVLFVLLCFTASGYLFGIFKRFLWQKQKTFRICFIFIEPLMSKRECRFWNWSISVFRWDVLKTLVWGGGGGVCQCIYIYDVYIAFKYG
jgi:hypothetical protein